MRAKQKQYGFTIVELLIVIVVIAILAAISVVAYNGIQTRAKNQQMATAVRTYYMAMKAYSVDNGSYPPNGGCLGSSDFYTSNPCYIGASTWIWNSDLNSALAQYVRSAPDLPTGRISSGANSASGIFYYAHATDLYIGFPTMSANSCLSIAGATFRAQSSWSPDMYCRINLPSL